MKAPILFLLGLFLFLFAGNNLAFAGVANTHLSRQSSAPIQNKKLEQQHTRTAEVAKDHRLIEKSQDVFEVENDDEDFVFAKKDILLVSYFIALAAFCYLTNNSRFKKSSLPFCAHFSYTASSKYLTQRVLRI